MLEKTLLKLQYQQVSLTSLSLTVSIHVMGSHSSLRAHLVVKLVADFLKNVMEHVDLLHRPFRVSVHSDQNKLFSLCRAERRRSQ